MPAHQPPPPGFVAPHIRHGRYIFLDAPANRPLALVCAGYEQCGRDFLVDRPSFRWHAVELLESGTCEVLRGGRWAPASAGTVVVYGPSRPGGVRAIGTGPHGKYFADFRGTAAARKLRGSGLYAKRVRHLANPGCAAELYEQLLSCSSLPAPAAEQSRRHYPRSSPGQARRGAGEPARHGRAAPRSLRPLPRIPRSQLRHIAGSGRRSPRVPRRPGVFFPSFPRARRTNTLAVSCAPAHATRREIAAELGPLGQSRRPRRRL